MAPSAPVEQPYYLVPDLRAIDPSAREIDLNSHTWMMPTIIEDDELTFGGKSLSAWYEEDRRQLSEEEQRGRTRVKQEYASSKQQHHHGHQRDHGHHHSHHHQSNHQHHQQSSQTSGSEKKC